MSPLETLHCLLMPDPLLLQLGLCIRSGFNIFYRQYSSSELQLRFGVRLDVCGTIDVRHMLCFSSYCTYVCRTYRAVTLGFVVTFRLST